MKSFKKVMAALLAATLVFSMAGCSSKSDDQGASTTTPEPTVEVSSNETTPEAAQTESDSTIEPCEITFWHSMSGDQETSLTALTDKFNSENEYGINVTLVNQGYYSDLSTKLTANAAADTLPDMAQAYNNWIIPYLDKVVALDDFVANDFDNYEDLIEGYRNECSEFGKIYALPFNKSTYVYFYNKTLFDELGLTAPETWEDVEAIGKAFKEQKGMVSLGFDDLAGMFEATLRQDGGSYLTAEGAQFDNETGLETLTYILDLYKNGYARLAGEDGYFSGPLSNQTIAAYVGSSTGVSYISADGFELGVAPLPGNKEKAANQAGTNLVMFSKDENKQKAVWEFMKYLTSVESTTTWAMETGYLPVRKSAFESETFQTFMQTNAAASAAYAQSGNFFSTITFDGSYDIMSTVNTKLEEIILMETDAETALRELVDEINAQIK